MEVEAESIYFKNWILSSPRQIIIECRPYIGLSKEVMKLVWRMRKEAWKEGRQVTPRKKHRADTPLPGQATGFSPWAWETSPYYWKQILIMLSYEIIPKIHDKWNYKISCFDEKNFWDLPIVIFFISPSTNF